LALRYAIPIRERGSIFNGMTGAQLKQLRKDLGEAIDRPLTVRDFAKLCGLPPESGGGTILEWENGYGPIGPVAALLSLLSVASDRYPIDEEIISETDAAFYRAMMRAGIIRRIG
jgi:transcriptional regulator with XRE-family HTH domain